MRPQSLEWSTTKATHELSKAVELRHAHTSDIVERRGANMFVWSTINGGLNDEGSLKYQLVASFHSKIVGPVSASRLLHWMNLLLPIVDENHVDSEFMIRPVSLTRLKPFLYCPDPVDEMVPPSKILSPRDYGCFYRDERRAFYGDYPITRFYPLEVHEKIFNENEEDKEGLIRVESLSETSAAAPSKVCVLSGDKLNIAVNWILPPSRVDRAAVQGGLVPDADVHECVENLLTMRSDLYSKFWLSHSLAVDVDEDFRIRAFTKDASDLKTLRQQLWQPSDLPEASRLYFREHFKLALSYYLAGGDIRKGNDASGPAQSKFMNGVGVGKNTPPDEANYIRYEKEWQTPMGIEILSTMWPLSELPSIAQEVVRGDSLEDAMTGLALK